MGVGIAMVTVGGIALLTGIVLSALPDPATTCTEFQCTTPTNYARVAGIILSGVGGIFVGVGVPLTLVGARKVPVDPNEPFEEAKRESPLKLRLGPGSVALSYRF